MSLVRLLPLLVVLYPPIEFFVWTPLMMKIYCPKLDSDAPSVDQKRHPYGDAQTLLVIESVDDPRGLSSIVLSLTDSVDEIVIPASRLAPPELQQYLEAHATSRGSYVSFHKMPITSDDCAMEAALLQQLLGQLPKPEQEQALGSIERVRAQEQCIGASLIDSVHPDYVYLLRDSTISTIAGSFRFREAIGVPMALRDGELTRFQSGRLDPTLPVTRLVSRLLSNGYLSCSLYSS
jgi:hypothetical protein